MSDPPACKFNPSSLECTGADGPGCLTPAQVAALNKMYEGPRNPRTGEQLYPGWPRSSEALTSMPTECRARAGTSTGHIGACARQFLALLGIRRSGLGLVVVRFRSGRGARRRAGREAGRSHQRRPVAVQATRRQGDRLSGLADPVVNALDTIPYYDRIRAPAAPTRCSVLPLVPRSGYGALRGWTGTTNFGGQGGAAPVVDADHDLLAALDAWVERGRAGRIIASASSTAGPCARGRSARTATRRLLRSGQHGRRDQLRMPMTPVPAS